MLPKKYRLKNTSAFNATYKNHHVVSDGYVCLYLGKEKSNPENRTRIAFIVSKKIHKRAVVRNRIKRLMRECIRLSLKNNQLPNINKYISIICIAKNASVNASFDEINASFHALFTNKA